MRKVLYVLLMIAGCDSVDTNNRETSHKLKIIPEIRYFRDPRVNLCFGYFYQRENAGGASTGGPALASVPCEAVERLLVNGPADFRKFDGEITR